MTDKDLVVGGAKLQRVDFEQESVWVEVKLADGTVLKLKTNVNWIMRLVDQWDDNGEPRYNVNMDTKMRFVSVPEKLMKPVVADLTQDEVSQINEVARKAKDFDPYGKKAN